MNKATHYLITSSRQTVFKCHITVILSQCKCLPGLHSALQAAITLSSELSVLSEFTEFATFLGSCIIGGPLEPSVAHLAAIDLNPLQVSSSCRAKSFRFCITAGSTELVMTSKVDIADLKHSAGFVFKLNPLTCFTCLCLSLKFSGICRQLSVFHFFVQIWCNALVQNSWANPKQKTWLVISSRSLFARESNTPQQSTRGMLVQTTWLIRVVWVRHNTPHLLSQTPTESDIQTLISRLAEMASLFLCRLQDVKQQMTGPDWPNLANRLQTAESKKVSIPSIQFSDL